MLVRDKHCNEIFCVVLIMFKYESDSDHVRLYTARQLLYFT
jgi:hypothetical protein